MIKRLQVPFRTECVSQSVDPKSRLTAPGVRYDEEPRRTVQGVSMSSTRVKDSISHSAHNGDYHWPVTPIARRQTRDTTARNELVKKRCCYAARSGHLKHVRIDGLRAAWSKHSVLYLMKGLPESAMSSGPIDPGLTEDYYQGPYALLAWNEILTCWLRHA